MVSFILVSLIAAITGVVEIVYKRNVSDVIEIIHPGTLILEWQVHY